jgi:hypothetical protein
MAAALRHLAEGIWPPAEEDRRAIAEFVGLQVVRGSDFREKVDDFFDRVAKKLAQHMGVTGAGLASAYRQAHGRDPTEAELRDLQRSLAEGSVTAKASQNYHVMLLLQSAGELALIAYAKRLSLLESDPGSVFVTGDVPVTMWDSSPGSFGSTSLMMADEVCLALDPTRSLLFMHPEGPNQRGQELREGIPDARVRELNRRAVAEAHRFVFCRPGTEEEVTPFLTAGSPRAFRGYRDPKEP